MNRHTISLADFEGYVIRKELAGDGTKSLTCEVTPDGTAAFKVYAASMSRALSGGAPCRESRTLAEAIEAYNEL